MGSMSNRNPLAQDKGEDNIDKKTTLENQINSNYEIYRPKQTNVK